jgi:hypothetical protein
MFFSTTKKGCVIMSTYTFRGILLSGFVILANNLHAVDFTAWIEAPNDPIYTPYDVDTLLDDYFPAVIFNANNFDGNGAAVPYKMWHQGPTGIALSYSNDGSVWTLVGVVVADPTIAPSAPLHAAVIYDQNGFGGTPYYYKMWYWTGGVGFFPPSLAIKSTESADGVIWTVPVDNTQDTTFFLADISQDGSYFYQFYGFGQMMYNPSATSVPGEPFTFPYVAFFDSSAAEIAPQTTQEAVGLAYSSDGINWIRFGSAPVLIPSGSTSDWDGKYAYRASIITTSDGTYHMFYSGSSEINNPDPDFSYTYGIGHATSTDGITWTRDPSNPIFTINDGAEGHPNAVWRAGRTLAPSVTILQRALSTNPRLQEQLLQMWFSGGLNNVGAFQTASIGYATLSFLLPFVDRMWLLICE